MLDNMFVGEESCLFETIHSFIYLEVNYVLVDVLVDAEFMHSFVGN